MSSNIDTLSTHVDHSFIRQQAVNIDTAKNNESNLSTAQSASETKKQVEEKNSTVSKSIDVETISTEKVAKQQAEQKVSEDEIEQALEVVSSFINSTVKQVDFSRDNNAGKMVITVTDRETQEVINQFPSDKIILMAEKIKELHQEVESISGLIIDSHV